MFASQIYIQSHTIKCVYFLLRARHGFEEVTTEQDILQEFILNIYSDSQLSEIIDVSPCMSDIDTDIDNERDIVQRGFRQWTYYTNLICCPVG